VLLRLLHLCDSLFPIGSFGYSDGLEAAVVRAPSGVEWPGATYEGLRDWLDVCLDETIGRLEGPTVWRAHRAFASGDGAALAILEDETIALRPSSEARKASRSMGHRLLTTWAAIYPDPRLNVTRSLPVAFGCVCAASDIDARSATEAFAYTRLAATASAAMRLMRIGQTDAHRVLARTLGRVPAVVDGLIARDANPESFMPNADIALMTHQYLHSRLFRT
jgi:urease accessory protein